MKAKAENILMKAPKNPDKYGFQNKDFYGFCEKPDVDYDNLRGVVFAHRHKFENLIFPAIVLIFTSNGTTIFPFSSSSNFSGYKFRINGEKKISIELGGIKVGVKSGI